MTADNIKDHIRQLRKYYGHDNRIRNNPIKLSGNKEELIKRILEFQQLENKFNTQKRSIPTVIFDGFFMKPVTEKLHMKKGHINEDKVLKNIPLFFKDPNVNINLFSLRKIGLLGRRDLPYVITSVDGLAIVEINRILQLAGMEIKTRSADKETQCIQSVKSEHGQSNEVHFTELERMKQFIPNASYRQQLLHHAACIDFDENCIKNYNNNSESINEISMFFFETTDGGKIEYCTRVLFPKTILRRYRAYIFYAVENYAPYCVIGLITRNN